MNCKAILKGTDKQCDWSSDHPYYAHVNKELQMLWTDKGIRYSVSWIFPWDALPDEMKAVIDKSKTQVMWGNSHG